MRLSVRTFFEWYGIGISILILGFLVIGNIIRIVYFIKCIKIKKCSDRNCRVNEYCPKYKFIWTDADIKEMQELTDRLLGDTHENMGI